jgi:hypothetical protein
MPQAHRSRTALPAVAATAAAVALVSGCSSAAPTSEQHPSITFGSQASTTPGMVGQGTPESPVPGTSHGESSTAPLPGAGESVVFERNIRPLFRQSDRETMKWAFDLWSYTDVKTHARAIAERLRDGSMPCDGAWSAEKVDAFQRWIDSGMAP